MALKLLPADVAARPGLKERFLREARTAARLSHPNIVPIHTVDEVAGFVFFAMAYVEGGTLADRIRTRGPLSVNDAVRVLREVSWALAHAHLHGVVHRDVKPENILLEGGTGRAMVTDFGIAALAGGEGGEPPREVVGTAEFMSPEQARGGEVDGRSDLYALGCVGFYALSGRVPFSAPLAGAVLAQHLTQPPPPLLSVAPHVPANVAAAIDRCLRKEPPRRFAGAEAFAEALGPELRASRELPVPLRVFIKQNRAWEGTLAWSVLGLFVAVPAFLGSLAAGLTLPAATWGGLFAAFGSFPLVKLLRDVRRVLRAGFTLDDVTAAFAQDIELKDEEFRFEVGSRVNMTDAVIRWVKWFGVAGASAGVTLAVLGRTDMPTFGLIAWSLLNTLVASEVEAIRARGRADVEGERWLGLWRGWMGKALFRVSGLGLERVAPAVSGVHRPTEVALGLAADRLFEELPRELRRQLGDLPGTVKALEDDAQAMRRHVSELDSVLAEIGDDDPDRPGAGERRRVRSAVEATRDEARAKLQQAVKALETVRLGLLLLQGKGGTVEHLTRDLSAAREMAGALDDLLAGHQEVARLLRERRTAGRLTLPEPGASETHATAS